MLRQARDWRQGDLATASGLSRSEIGRLEGGQPSSIRTAKQVAAAFGISIFRIAGREDVPGSELESPRNKVAAAAAGREDRISAPRSTLPRLDPAGFFQSRHVPSNALDCGGCSGCGVRERGVLYGERV